MNCACVCVFVCVLYLITIFKQCMFFSQKCAHHQILFKVHTSRIYCIHREKEKEKKRNVNACERDSQTLKKNYALADKENINVIQAIN